jgi:carboxyl-terminal processing protease
MKKYKILIITGFLSLVFSTRLSWGKSEKDIYAEVIENIQLFGKIYEQVANRYIEEIDPDKFMRAGIQGMLDQLDPYTVYLEPESQDELAIMTQGKYYGVGMRITNRNGWPTVAEQPFPNSPSFHAGIREGDQIIEIDGKSTKSEKLDATARRLRGPSKGSEVVIKIIRVGEDKPITFRLLRDEIVVSDIDYTGFVEPGIGLISLSRFNRSAGQQVRDAIERLLDQGMEALIFDLRNDPGGLLDVAVAVAGNFLPKDELIVFTQGRESNSRQDYRSQTDPVYGSMPLVLLVNGNSASASEIVAGAIQDLDRGVIVGQETFGKGLVQTVIPLDRRGEHQLKMTTWQYFIPSGRLIQRSDVFNHGANSVFADADSTAGDSNSTDKKKDEKKYFTKNGRVVNGGGGIKPDIEVKNSYGKTTEYTRELIQQSMFFNFSLEYINKKPTLERDFTVTDEMLKEFFEFLQQKKFDYEPDGMEELKKIEKISQDEGYLDQMTGYIGSMRNEFNNIKEQDRLKSIDHIKLLLKREIAGKLFGTDAGYESMFKSDSVLVRAVQVLKNPEEYNKTLNVKMAEGR